VSLGAGPSDLGLIPGPAGGGPVRRRRRARVSWRAVTVAAISTVVFFAALAGVVTAAPGWN
jgi:hypothetical protein